jgi:hypothetical protein
MSENGEKMNHSTARNIFLSAMEKIAVGVSKQYEGETISSKEMSKDPRFQESIYDFLVDI